MSWTYPLPLISEVKKVLSENIFLVGAQKCGTSSLGAAMERAFPDIELSAPKEPMIFSLGDADCHRSHFCSSEVRFFLSDEEKLSKYRACFKTSRPVKMDASTSYMVSRSACADIERILPGSRAIILLRDPVMRLVSAYWHYVRTGVVTQRLDRAIEFGPRHLLECGAYAEQVERVIAEFGRERVLVASDHHVHLDPVGFTHVLERFTGLTASGQLVIGRENSGAYPWLVSAQLFANLLRQASQKSFVYGAKARRRLESYGICGAAAELFSRFNLTREARPLLESRLTSRIVEYYRRENDGIDRLLDFGSTEHWYGDYSLFLRV